MLLYDLGGEYKTILEELCHNRSRGYLNSELAILQPGLGLDTLEL